MVELSYVGYCWTGRGLLFVVRLDIYIYILCDYMFVVNYIRLDYCVSPFSCLPNEECVPSLHRPKQKPNILSRHGNLHVWH